MSEPLHKRMPRGFRSLMFTQFQGAFSDNALRWLVIFPVLASVVLSEADKEGFASHASLLFAVPFLLFSTVGGWMADRFSKRSVMVGVKLGEIAIMLFAAVALWKESQPLQLAAICLMGIHSTIFAPAKYGIMPEVLPPESSPPEMASLSSSPSSASSLAPSPVAGLRRHSPAARSGPASCWPS
ncbi:MAG: acyl-[ACP]--phospholipid O-acyltransferase, partial [Verrucomicrobiaceae bacterium]